MQYEQYLVQQKNINTVTDIPQSLSILTEIVNDITIGIFLGILISIGMVVIRKYKP